MNKVDYYKSLHSRELELWKKRQQRCNRRRFDLKVMEELIEEVEDKYTIDPKKGKRWKQMDWVETTVS